MDKPSHGCVSSKVELLTHKSVERRWFAKREYEDFPV